MAFRTPFRDPDLERNPFETFRNRQKTIQKSPEKMHQQIHKKVKKIRHTKVTVRIKTQAMSPFQNEVIYYPYAIPLSIAMTLMDQGS